ncbi:MAG: DUF5690 family protein [Verrucomicrobiota bacterium]|nr:DUF5690 family protein [Verrucomicrobiota bacterium]
MIKRWLSQANPWLFSLYCMFAAFSTYFCMYAFRKPYGAATYEGLEFFGTGMTLKGAFLISQIIGYTISKYWGCKFCSEINRASQAKALILMIVIAEIALLCFALVPNDFKVLAIFINGLPLGMVWGLVSRYLEGRGTTELLFAGLSCSYIFASSSVKTVGAWVMGFGVPEFWMPVTVGAIFLLPFFVSVFFLDKLPPPSDEEVISRSKRTVMGGKERKAFMKQFFLGMVFLLVVYFFITAYRDFRDNYMPEVFRDMGYEAEPTLFSKADYPTGVGVMIVLALLNLVKNHRRGLLAVFGVMISGMLLMIGATLLKDQEKISGLTWMILIGFGGYLAYVPFGAVLFERVIASTKAAGTAVFAIYVADAVGYTGAVGVQLYKDFGQPNLNYYDFLRQFTYLMAFGGIILFISSMIYFYRKTIPDKALKQAKVD